MSIYRVPKYDINTIFQSSPKFALLNVMQIQIRQVFCFILWQNIFNHHTRKKEYTSKCIRLTQEINLILLPLPRFLNLIIPQIYNVYTYMKMHKILCFSNKLRCGLISQSYFFVFVLVKGGEFHLDFWILLVPKMVISKLSGNTVRSTHPRLQKAF